MPRRTQAQKRRRIRKRLARTGKRPVAYTRSNR